jgi:preprotein translocase subunit SecD
VLHSWGKALCCLVLTGSPLAWIRPINASLIAQLSPEATTERIFQLQLPAGSDGQTEQAATLQVFRQRLKLLGLTSAQLRTEGGDRVVLTVPQSMVGQAISLLQRSDNVAFAVPKSGQSIQLAALLAERAEAIQKVKFFDLLSAVPSPESYQANLKTKQRLAEIDRQLPSLFESPILASQNIVNAEILDNPANGGDRSINWIWQRTIKLSFDAMGMTRLTQLNQSLVGTRNIGVLINGILVSNDPLQLQKDGAGGGAVTITSFWDLAEPESLVLSLKSGVLPVPVRLLAPTP